MRDLSDRKCKYIRLSGKLRSSKIRLMLFSDQISNLTQRELSTEEKVLHFHLSRRRVSTAPCKKIFAASPFHDVDWKIFVENSWSSFGWAQRSRVSSTQWEVHAAMNMKRVYFEWCKLKLCGSKVCHDFSSRVLLYFFRITFSTQNNEIVRAAALWELRKTKQRDVKCERLKIFGSRTRSLK